MNARDYSRTEYVFGREALKKMQAASFLIIGCSGVGAEVAKNLVLTGVDQVSLVDPEPARFLDLSSNPFLTDAHVAAGTSRADAIAGSIQELNSRCKIQVLRPAALVSNLTAKLASYSVVLHTHEFAAPLTFESLGDLCHSCKVPYIMASTSGLAGRIFVDFLDRFTVFDADGERTEDISISSCTLDVAGDAVRLFFETTEPHNLADTFLIHIRDLKFSLLRHGTAQVAEPRVPAFERLVNDQHFRIRVTGHSLFEAQFDSQDVYGSVQASVAEARARGLDIVHARGGYLRRLKEPVDMSFKCYSQAVQHPEFPEDVLDFAKFSHPEVLHALFTTLDLSKNKSLRSSVEDVTARWNSKLCELVYQHLLDDLRSGENAAATIVGPSGAPAAELLSAEPNKELAMLFLKTATAQLAPVCTFIGAWAAQEALNFVSSKYMPICQFMYYDCFEALPPKDSRYYPTFASTRPLHDRYDAQRLVFGGQLQHKIQVSSLFLVGAGALGCELAKLLALLGACTAPGAVLDITDLDTIENSNLSRQFLFRERDIGKLKSAVASERIKAMNPEINTRALSVKVCEETEDVLNEAFYAAKDLIVNALDNVRTRKYVDTQCVLYSRPLLESGTMGPKSNSLVVVPRLTETYSASAGGDDDTTGEAPACTIHNFPNNIVHCVVYATSEFKGLFSNAVKDLLAVELGTGVDIKPLAESLIKDESSLSTRLVQLSSLLNVGRERSPMETAFAWACALYSKYFIETINNLLQSFPLDYKDKDGTPFWNSAKRPPHPLVFSRQNEHHRDFVRSASRLYAESVLGLSTDQQGIASYDAAVDFAEQYFSPENVAARKSILTNEGITKLIQSSLPQNTFDNVCAFLSTNTLFNFNVLDGGVHSNPLDFQKDDETNGHVSFVSSLANLRAECYDIPQESSFEIRRLAGNIIPAMITSTAAIVGLVGVELYKIILHNEQDAKDRHGLSAYKCSFMNLATPLCQFTEPVEYKPKTIKTLPEGQNTFTEWDFLDFCGSDTVDSIVSAMSERFKASVDMVTLGTRLIFCSWSNSGRGGQTIAEIVGQTASPSGKTVYLTVSAVDDNGDDVEIPTVRVRL